MNLETAKPEKSDDLSGFLASKLFIREMRALASFCVALRMETNGFEAVAHFRARRYA
jgi:hypothetical protein